MSKQKKAKGAESPQDMETHFNPVTQEGLGIRLKTNCTRWAVPLSKMGLGSGNLGYRKEDQNGCLSYCS
jgi:hypothetical protein